MPKFLPPNEKTRLEAIGLEKTATGYSWKASRQPCTQNLPPIKYFTPDGIPLILEPKRGDWLAEHSEPGQSFARFSTGPRSHPRPRMKTIYFQPLEFYENQTISESTLNTLCEYASLFFMLPVKLLKPIVDLDGKGKLKSVTRRINEYTNEAQTNASEIMQVLKQLKPSNAFCIAGLTLCDIYPREEWNFVFGLANSMDGMGVYSLSRYMPETPERPMILRAVRVMCHEICHMFGIKHCIFFSCLMNGSNHAEEALTRPSFLCPVCLRKLHFAIEFNLDERYQKMLEFWQKIQEEDSRNIFEEHVEWLKTRI